MNKILTLITACTFLYGAHAQEAAEKKVQTGIIIGTGLNIQKMGTKNFETNGVGGDFNIGGNVNISINNYMSFTTGIELDFSTTRFKPTATNSFNQVSSTYYRFDDTKILQKSESTPTNTLFQLEERSQKATYLSVPTMMLFRTKFIGNFRYFAKFGLRNSFLISNKVNDKGRIFEGNVESGVSTAAENKGMKSSKDLFFYKGSFGLAMGSEWNFSGSTCLLAELGYYYGFTPLYSSPSKDDKMSLYSSGLENGTGSNSYFVNKATQSQIMLKVSILF